MGNSSKFTILGSTYPTVVSVGVVGLAVRGSLIWMAIRVCRNFGRGLKPCKPRGWIECVAELWSLWSLWSCGVVGLWGGGVVEWSVGSGCRVDMVWGCVCRRMSGRYGVWIWTDAVGYRTHH